MKPIDEEGRGAKLDSLKELLKMVKSGTLEKLPKGKGMTMMSVSVSKPKKEDVHEEMEPELEAAESEGIEEMEEGLSKMKEAHSMEPMAEEMEEGEMPEMEEDSEEEDEYELPEPSVPADLMELVKLMMKRKQEEE